MRIIRITELMAMTGLSMSTLMRMERTGRLPRRRKISKQAMGWLSEEIEAWMKALPVIPDQDQPKTPQDGPGSTLIDTPVGGDGDDV